MIRAVIFDYDWVLTRYYFMPQKKLFQLARQIHRQGIKTAVLSNRITPLGWLARLNPSLKDFDVVIFASPIGPSKPSPESYQAIIKKLGVKPEECLFIDNRSENIEAAEDLGMAVVWSKDTDQTVDNIKRLMKV